MSGAEQLCSVRSRRGVLMSPEGVEDEVWRAAWRRRMFIQTPTSPAFGRSRPCAPVLAVWSVQPAVFRDGQSRLLKAYSGNRGERVVSGG